MTIAGGQHQLAGTGGGHDGARLKLALAHIS
jgi:hypothetical protein